MPDAEPRVADASGHNYVGHNYIGHNHIGHNYISTLLVWPVRSISRLASVLASATLVLALYSHGISVMAYIVMTYTVMAYMVMAYIVMAYIVMAYIVVAYVVMAKTGFGLGQRNFGAGPI